LLTWAGEAIFRLKRMKPHGFAAAISWRSAVESSVPDTPVMNARVPIRAD
jgi:hypothetical protein